jgi:hypothetical protein
MLQWRYDLNHANVGSTWGLLERFTLRPLYPRGKSPPYPSHRRLGGTQGWSIRFAEDKNLLPLPEMELCFLGFSCQARVLITLPASHTSFSVSTASPLPLSKALGVRESHSGCHGYSGHMFSVRYALRLKN